MRIAVASAHLSRDSRVQMFISQRELPQSHDGESGNRKLTQAADKQETRDVEFNRPSNSEYPLGMLGELARTLISPQQHKTNT